MSIVREIELAHRRLERAKRIVKDGLIWRIKGSDLFICQSQTGNKDESYLIGPKQPCGCEDAFQLDGRKRCKHTFAALMLYEGIDPDEIGADPFYWRRHRDKTDAPRGEAAEEVGINGETAATA